MQPSSGQTQRQQPAELITVVKPTSRTTEPADAAGATRASHDEAPENTNQHSMVEGETNRQLNQKAVEELQNSEAEPAGECKTPAADRGVSKNMQESAQQAGKQASTPKKP
jgi:hypothetical protein